MKYKVILASNSPRRKELMAGMNLDYEVKVIPNIDETYPDYLPVTDVPLFIAEKKAAAYNVIEGELCLTADTVVVLNDKIFGKPHDADDAYRILRELSGNTHSVITGVCLKTCRCKSCFTVTTTVTFKELKDEEIHYYISYYKPFDKAGAYGIQEWIGYIGVESIKGSYFNVMGFPTQRIYEEIKKIENE